ncbi:MAG: hypothetical protein HN487_09085 [Flavobacterium sp.]|jgi:hypothetical protein|nr:hypothetical protein [Flavobacterium sp.]|tara:strand:- start:3412 stop:3684 length:273 start_codon:yes stop_codon:yes gene_type:complete
MDNIFKYFDFSPFKKDASSSFDGNEISYTELNSEHFLIFEKEQQHYNLYVSKYNNEAEIGNISPEILEILVTNYDKSNSDHRVALRRYLG